MTAIAPRVDLDRRLADQLLSEWALPLLAHLVLLALILVLVWDALPNSLLISWAGSVIGIAGLRAILWGRARIQRAGPGTVIRLARITMIILGLAWGIGTAVAAQTLPLGTVAILLVALAGLLSGGIATLIGDRWVFPLYAAAMFGPVVIGVELVAQERPEHVVAVLMAAFLAFTIRLHRRTHDLFRERLTAESDLRDQERQLAEAQALTHAGSWEWDIRADRVTWSDELYRIYGLPPDAKTGYPEFLQVVHPDDRARLKHLIEQQFAERHPLEYEWRALRPNGEIRHLFSRQVVVTDATGEPVRMLGTSLDFTERKIQEVALRSALTEIKTLRGMLRICANCKRVSTENGGWESLDAYVRDHTHAEFSHGLCPDCARTWAPS